MSSDNILIMVMVTAVLLFFTFMGFMLWQDNLNKRACMEAGGVWASAVCAWSRPGSEAP